MILGSVCVGREGRWPLGSGSLYLSSFGKSVEIWWFWRVLLQIAPSHKFKITPETLQHKSYCWRGSLISSEITSRGVKDPLVEKEWSVGGGRTVPTRVWTYGICLLCCQGRVPASGVSTSAMLFLSLTSSYCSGFTLASKFAREQKCQLCLIAPSPLLVSLSVLLVLWRKSARLKRGGLGWCGKNA